ncbi:diguanylate cyclase [Halobacillus halophilus]|nr:diguanylate cyclase [Halobacillus halophilus]
MSLFVIIQEFFINICIVIALVFMYLQFRWTKLLPAVSKQSSQWIDGLAGGILGIVLMYFSIQVTEQTIIDLRHLPVILILLYIGVQPALLSAVIIASGRLLYGINPSSMAAIALMVLLFIGYLWVYRKLHHRESPLKSSFQMLLWSNVVFSSIISMLVRDWGTLQFIIPIYWLISFIGGMLASYLVHYLRRSHYLFKKYEEQSSIDFLTGLYNVREFDRLWNYSVKNAVEKEEALSLLAIDIDFFKHVNDTYGHAAGDEVLRQLGKILSDITRSFDIVSRNGGEEFTVILLDCSNESGRSKAEKIRQTVEKHAFSLPDGRKISITVSIGVSTYPDQVTSAGELLEKADESLYEAKHSGRNKVISA